MENENPLIFESVSERPIRPEDEMDDVHDDIDSREIFGKVRRNETELVQVQCSIPVDLIRDINDPEHPLTLEQLNVVQQGHIEIEDDRNKVLVYFTPTIPHCSMATLIGLSLKVRLLRSLPERFKVCYVSKDVGQTDFEL